MVIAMADRINGYELMGRYGTAIALIVLLGFNFAFTPNFTTWQTLNVNLTQVCTIVIVAVGMTLVIATGGIDLSVGSLMAISGALAPMIFMGKLFEISSIYVAVVMAMSAAVLVTALLGAFNGWLIAKFRIQPIVATLVLFIAGRGIAQVITNGTCKSSKCRNFR
jgi:galactofuranose transport system permease protein